MSKSTGSGKNEVKVKAGTKVNIDGQWFTVTAALAEPDTWELTGYCIPGGMTVKGKKLILQKTSDEILEYVGNHIADQVLREGFRLPVLKAERERHPGKHRFIQKMLTLRQEKRFTALSV